MIKTIKQKIKKLFQCLTKKEKIKQIDKKQMNQPHVSSMAFVYSKSNETNSIKTIIQNYYQLYHHDVSYAEKEKQLKKIIQKINEFKIANDFFMMQESKDLFNRFENAIKLTLQNVITKNSHRIQRCEKILQTLIK